MPRITLLPLTLLLTALLAPVHAEPFKELGAAALTGALADILRAADHYHWHTIRGNQVPGGPWDFCYEGPFAGETCEVAVTTYRYRPVRITVRPGTGLDPATWARHLHSNLVEDYGEPVAIAHEGWGNRTGWAVDSRYLLWREGTDGAPMYVVALAQVPHGSWFQVHPHVVIEKAAFTGSGKALTAKLTIRNTGSQGIVGKLPIDIGTWKTPERAFNATLPFEDLRKVMGEQGLQGMAKRAAVRQRFLTSPDPPDKVTRVWSASVKLAPGATTTIMVTAPVVAGGGAVLATAEVLDPTKVQP
ncbi:MAG TPA: hypothetical protein VEI97_07340 [bacterium]|nr:hypothetical protein [bacterium]